ncbi:xanthine dehydrogenase accessory factor [Aquamicrobium ahrensii]|uniref:Xanthine dehydrogenase accessory factor n=1 Tax=Aquamicrobium ahrensii TaxID=469551 RepID=A0ABV2KLH3_9HYPH
MLTLGELHNDPLAVGERWVAQGRGVALATVVETWGSAPRAAGSHLVVDAEGNFQGSVSGGCVEGAVVAEALEVIDGGKAGTLEFDVADEAAWQVGLSCGGRIRIYVEKLDRDSGAPGKLDVLQALNQERLARRAAVVVTDFGDGASRLLRQGDEVAGALGDAVREAFCTGRSRSVVVEGRTLFLNAHVPPPRLVVIGAVHISQALASLARTAGYAVEIIDPRTAFATPERFPGVTLHARWPQEVLAQTPLDDHTALAALTHDPKIDDMPLQAALGAGCFYVGALGSRKTHARRVERLQAAGLSSEQIARIHAPIGIDIAAEGPSEIAVAVLAEVIRAFRTRGVVAKEHAA